MATEEAEVAKATEEAKPAGGGGLGKTIGLGVGVFLLMIVAQFIAGIVGCKLMPGLMPGCGGAIHEEATEEKEAPAKAKKVKPEAPKAPPIYHAFDPPLVVSFQEAGTMRFLQVTVEVMARDEDSIAAVTTHMPVLRNNLLNLFSGKGFAELTSREGKEKLRKECLSEVQKIIKTNASKDHPAAVEDLYFTSFVVQ